MDLKLDRYDLECLVKGSFVSYKAMDNKIVKMAGSFSGSYGRWDWNYDMSKFTDEQLFEIYNVCKKLK